MDKRRVIRFKIGELNYDDMLKSIYDKNNSDKMEVGKKDMRK